MAGPAHRHWRFPLAFGALTLCLFYLLFSSWRAYDELLVAQRERLHSEQVLSALAALTGEVVPDGSRALCAMGGTPIGDSVLAPMDWRGSMAALRGLLAGSREQYERLLALNTALVEWQALYVVPLERACATQEKLGSAYVQSLARVAQPTRMRISGLIETLRGAEVALRARRETHVESVLQGAGKLFALVTLSSVVLGIVAVLTVHNFTNQLAYSNRRLRRESTERGIAQEQLQDSQRRLRMVLEHIPDAVIAFDASGRVQWLNPAGELMFGRSRQAVSGHPIALLIPALIDELDWPVTRPQAELDGSSPLPWTARRASMQGVRPGGAEFPIETALVQTRVEGDRIGVCVCRDMSETESTERMQREFVSMLTQELRAPLAGIRSSLAVLTGGNAGALDAATLRLVRLARDHGERAAVLVSDLQEFERLRTGTAPLRIEAIDLAERVRAAVEASEATAERKRVNLLAQTGPGRVTVRADSSYIDLVLARLLASALAATPAGAEVRIFVVTGNGEARVRIIDSGVGVPPERAARLFEPFALRGDAERGWLGDSGLGLAICRAAMQHMGGAVGFETAARPGEGAAFWISLPLRAAPA